MNKILFPSFLILITSCFSLKSQVPFEPHTILGGELCTIEAQNIHSVDLDNDSAIDILYTSDGQSKLAWFRNNGDGTYTNITIMEGGMEPTSIKPVDMDNDGDLDILYSTEDWDLSWLKNDGNGEFSPELINFSQMPTYCVDAFDMDNDGDLDFVYAGGSGYENGGIVWYENNDDFVKPKHELYSDPDITINEMHLCDIDDDQDLDFIISLNWFYYSDVLLLKNSGDFNFFNQFITTIAGFSCIDIGDLDGDSDLDLLCYSNNYDLTWFENNGDHLMIEFTEHLIACPVNTDSKEVIIADLDGDETNDIINCGYEDIAWLKNDGSQNFTFYEIDSEYEMIDINANDVDSDGDIDLLMSSTSSVFIYENDGTQNFLKTEITKSAMDARDVVSVDLDNDGDMDIVYAYWMNIGWLENDGSQNFTLHEIDSVGLFPEIHVEDMDGDNDMDILACNDGQYDESSIIWYKNDGFEVFDKLYIYNGSLNVQEINTEDVNDDGVIDILAAFEHHFV